MKFTPFPELKTERLILRRILESDWEVILFLRSDTVVNKYIQRKESDKTKNKEDAVNFIKKINKGIENNTFISWGITLKEDPKIIGTICLWNFSEDNKTAELGYDLHPTFQRKGFMTESLRSVVLYGFFELGLNKIEAFTHENNISSRNLLSNNHFILEPQRKDKNNPSNAIFSIEKS